MRNLLFSRKGQSMVEFALVLPVLLLLLLGIMEFGRILCGYVELQSVARDAARYAAVHTDATEDNVISKVKSDVIPPLLDPEKFDAATVDLTRTPSADKKDKWVTVTLDYSMDLLTPYFGAIIGGNSYNMHSTMVMRTE